MPHTTQWEQSCHKLWMTKVQRGQYASPAKPLTDTKKITQWSVHVGTAKWEERPNYDKVHKRDLPSRSMSRSQKAYVSNMATMLTRKQYLYSTKEYTHRFTPMHQYATLTRILVCSSIILERQQRVRVFLPRFSRIRWWWEFRDFFESRIHCTCRSIWLVACNTGNELSMRVRKAHAYRMHMQAGILKRSVVGRSCNPQYMHNA